MPLSPQEWTLLNAATLRLYRELDAERHAQAMLEVLNDLVPADSVVLNLLDITTGNYTVVTLPFGLAQPDEVELVGRHLNQSPFPPYYVATGDAHWKMTTDFMPVEDFHATALWKLGLSRWGINQQICGMLAVENAKVHALTINRTHRGFEERERELLNALHPHLVTSYLNAIAFSRAQESADQLRAVMETAPGAYGCLRDDGSLAWMQARAKTWLEDFFQGEAFAENGLPAPVEHDRLMLTAGTGTLHVERKKGAEVLFLCLSPSPLGGSILRLERREIHPELRFKALPLLSERENDVLRWMLEGKRNSEIGTILGISERTVEKHVAAVMTALDAENRATAIVRAMERMVR